MSTNPNMKQSCSITAERRVLISAVVEAGM